MLTLQRQTNTTLPSSIHSHFNPPSAPPLSPYPSTVSGKQAVPRPPFPTATPFFTTSFATTNLLTKT
ncbi:hypothetical protein L249_2334 [Ophiocordyceps polyrhachis-furcata BCC 54312]|uniref:Uncharacterized protein n=1 Tax=Ophiocordyceps polyrhachis-furcata BCC 54312 TaxID=1330021 RepID=A0A367LNS6_9HYPO|nr:hypothetical protein L249_2334 [Ophiocordyceps polyrhachis-furcata BCC 54312]